VADRVGGVAQRGLDVVVRQAWVGVEEVGLRRALGELAKDTLDRDASAAHDGLALEDGGVDLDTIGCCG
jgi:hypothetical protein